MNTAVCNADKSTVPAIVNTIIIIENIDFLSISYAFDKLGEFIIKCEENVKHGHLIY